MHSIPDPPATSRAWTITSRGLPTDVLSLIDRPTPTLPPFPLPKDVPLPEEWLLVRVAYAGLNPGAIFQMTLVPAMARKAPVNVPEMDLSGVVVDVWHPRDPKGPLPPAPKSELEGTPIGPTAPLRFARGDAVVAMLPASHALPTGTGALAEYVAIPARYAVPKPDNVSFADAAGLMLPALTARVLVQEAAIRPGDRVLVNGASGGIGTMAVQMARNIVGKEGKVFGVCSGKNAAMVMDLGADEVVDYTLYGDGRGAGVGAYLAEKYAAAPFDAAIDTLGFHALYAASPGYLKPDGIYESVGIKPPTFLFCDFVRAATQMYVNAYRPTSRYLLGVGRRWNACSMMNPTLGEREEVVGMLARGQLKVVRDSVWSFEEAKQAYAKLAGLHARGKVVVQVDAMVGVEDCE